MGAILSLSAAIFMAVTPPTPDKPKPNPPPQGVITVDDAKKCPAGWTILDSNMFVGNGTAISAPADAHICLVKNTLKDNKTGLELRPPGH